jgi:UDP-N-acetylglucosamine 2-epimerase (non-hydrolysing)
MSVNRDAIMIVAGTRPEAIKIAPVLWWLDKLGVNYIFIWSGQHYDYEMSKIFFEQLRLPEPDEYLDVGAQAQDVAQQVALLIQRLVSAIKRYNPQIIYALGDTNTTLAAALASVYTAKPFIHDEAGMRSFDSSMLEENNRKIADAIANFRLAPTKIAVLNLLYEGAPPHTIRLVGSAAVDVLIYVISRKLLKEEIFNLLELKPSEYLIFTIHRRENLTAEKLQDITFLLTEISNKLPNYKIIFPIHPHTRKRLDEAGLLKTLSSCNNIVLTEPLGYFEFITLIKEARVVVTDSGGVQEEALILGKKTITLRKTTEWPETFILGYNNLVDLDNINKTINVIIKSVEEPEPTPPQLSTCPLGDGNAGRRVAKLLQTFSEANIKRGFEEQGYPLPRLTTNIKDLALCFKNGLPFVFESFEGGTNKFCVLRENLTVEDMIQIIKTDWSMIDKILGF